MTGILLLESGPYRAVSARSWIRPQGLDSGCRLYRVCPGSRNEVSQTWVLLGSGMAVSWLGTRWQVLVKYSTLAVVIMTSMSLSWPYPDHLIQ